MLGARGGLLSQAPTIPLPFSFQCLPHTPLLVALFVRHMSSLMY